MKKLLLIALSHNDSIVVIFKEVATFYLQYYFFLKNCIEV